MGEAGKDALRVGFDRTVKLEFHGSRVSLDAGRKAGALARSNARIRLEFLVMVRKQRLQRIDRAFKKYPR